MSSKNRRVGSTESALTAQEAPGEKIENGPYLAIVKSNIDTTRSGRIQVFIPALGGDEKDPTHWRTVKYASPFFGTTTIPEDKDPKRNHWTTVPHTYGMWMTPPDLENHVLVMFVMGNPGDGYYFAGVIPNLGKHMVPAIGSSEAIDRSVMTPELVPYLKGKKYPVAEFSEAVGFWDQRNAFMSITKPVHEPLVRILLEQGLEDDLTRGSISSSAQREAPSSVFGISTPGKASPNSSDLDNITGSPKFRLGGHSFIMDDGDKTGDNNLVRIRTSGGHQIMLNDTDGSIHVTNAAGTGWFEFNRAGDFNMFATGSINMRSLGGVNIQSMGGINVEAPTTNFYGGIFSVGVDSVSLIGYKGWHAFGKGLNLNSSTTLNIAAKTSGTFNGGSELIFSAGKIHLNTMNAPGPIIDEPPLPGDVKVTKKNGLKWTLSSKITTMMPASSITCHEPWPGHTGKKN